MASGNINYVQSTSVAGVVDVHVQSVSDDVDNIDEEEVLRQLVESERALSIRIVNEWLDHRCDFQNYFEDGDVSTFDERTSKARTSQGQSQAKGSQRKTESKLSTNKTDDKVNPDKLIAKVHHSHPKELPVRPSRAPREVPLKMLPQESKRNGVVNFNEFLRPYVEVNETSFHAPMEIRQNHRRGRDEFFVESEQKVSCAVFNKSRYPTSSEVIISSEIIVQASAVREPNTNNAGANTCTVVPISREFVHDEHCSSLKSHEKLHSPRENTTIHNLVSQFNKAVQNFWRICKK